MSIRFGRSGNGYDSSQVMETADDDWRQITDLAERRKIQNRLAQRNYRRKLRQRLEELERQAGESTPSSSGSSSSTPSTTTGSTTPVKKQTTTKPKKTTSASNTRPRTASLSAACGGISKPRSRGRANSTRSLCSLPSDRNDRDYVYSRQQLTPPMSTVTSLSTQSSPNIPAYHNFPYTPSSDYYSTEYTPMFAPTPGPTPPSIKVEQVPVSSALGIWSSAPVSTSLSSATCNAVPEITVSSAAAAELMTRLSQPMSSPPLGSAFQHTEYPALPSTYINTPPMAPTSPPMYQDNWSQSLPSPPMDVKRESELDQQAWTLAEVTAAEMMYPTCAEPMQRATSWPHALASCEADVWGW